MKNAKLLLVFFCLINGASFAQNAKILKEINKHVYIKFYEAFETLDYKKMAEIHSADLVRIPANRKAILDYAKYIGNYKSGFEDAKAKNITNNIELRFFERICNDSTASDRGIYKFTVNKRSEVEKNYYGQFFVLLKKIAGQWKIVLDYDSNENNTIDENSFQKAHHIDEVNIF